MTKLGLYRNNIGPNGASALSEMLRLNGSLRELDLRSNDIGHKGASALAESLQTNTALTKLGLRYNQIGHDGAAALAEVLQNNTTITVRLHGDLEGGQQHIMKTRYGNLLGNPGSSRTHGQHLEEVHGIVALSRANDDNKTDFQFVNIGSHLKEQPDVEWEWEGDDNNPFTLFPDHGIPVDARGIRSIRTFKGPDTFYDHP